MGSQYPTRYLAAGNEGGLDAAPLHTNLFFSHTGSSGNREYSYIMEQYIDWKWFQNHASYVIPAIIQIILGEEFLKRPKNLQRMFLGRKDGYD